jgi:CBS domain containing-hemolysin-like protein
MLFAGGAQARTAPMLEFSPMFTFVLLRVLAVLLLVAANAFFVAAEFALVSIRDTRIEQLVEARRIGARTVRKLHGKLGEMLNGVQLGITMASLALGWLGENALARVLEHPLARVAHASLYAHAAAVALAFGLITYFHVILGEVVPKSISLQQSERVALAVAAPLDVFMTVFGPFLKFMAGSSRFVLRLFGSHEVRAAGVHSPEELKLIVTASRRFGLIPPLQEEMIHRALELEMVTVREIMVPRVDIFSLSAEMPLEEALKRVVEEQHSRVPVYDPQRGPEAIIGVLYAKDMMRAMIPSRAEATGDAARAPAGDERLRRSHLRVRHIMRDVLVVPETKPLPDLLEEFKRRKRHLAVVVDEFGSTAGVVTAEDVLEQLVGEIEDEYDIPSQALLAGPNIMVLEGSTSIRDLETQYQLRLPRDEGFETLAGFVMTTLQRIPAASDSFEFEGRRYTVERMDGHRVEAVRIEQLETVREK